VDVRSRLAGSRVLVAPQWIHAVDWRKRTLTTPSNQAELERSPQFDPRAPVNRAYEQRLYDYHGRPKYWERRAEA
jgi:hypothetical protein